MLSLSSNDDGIKFDLFCQLIRISLPQSKLAQKLSLNIIFPLKTLFHYQSIVFHRFQNDEVIKID